MAVLAVDTGGTRLKLGVVENGAVLARTTVPVDNNKLLAPQLPRIAEALRGIIDPSVTVSGVGMAFPSLVDFDAAKILGDSGKYVDAETLDLPAWAQAEFEVPFAVENDARMATIGEWRYGAARGVDSLAMVTLGTGIGTGIVIDGEVLRGKHGQAGCLGGHLTLRVGGRPCLCGSIGCAETEASTSALPALVADDPDYPGSKLSEVPTLDYAAIFSLAEAGDGYAIKLRDHSLEVWSALAVTLVHAYDPEMIVFGGGILASGEAILAPVREYVHRHAWTPWGKVRIVGSELGDDAALVACEWLVQSRQARIS